MTLSLAMEYAKPIADGKDLGNPGYCRCGYLSDRSAASGCFGARKFRASNKLPPFLNLASALLQIGT